MLQEDVVEEKEVNKQGENLAVIEESSIGDVELFQQHCLKSGSLIGPAEDSPACSPGKEGLTQTPLAAKTGKISTKLFNGSKRKSRVQKAEERDESGLFKRKEKSKRGKKGDKTTLNGYDSDSVDLDKLASYTRRTFCLDVVSPTGDSSTDESPFAALIRKPLIKERKVETKPTVNNENDIQTDNNDVSLEGCKADGGKEEEYCLMMTENVSSKVMSTQIPGGDDGIRNKSSQKTKKGRSKKRQADDDVVLLGSEAKQTKDNAFKKLMTKREISRARGDCLDSSLEGLIKERKVVTSPTGNKENAVCQTLCMDNNDVSSEGLKANEGKEEEHCSMMTGNVFSKMMSTQVPGGDDGIRNKLSLRTKKGRPKKRQADDDDVVLLGSEAKRTKDDAFKKLMLKKREISGTGGDCLDSSLEGFDLSSSNTRRRGKQSKRLDNRLSNCQSDEKEVCADVNQEEGRRKSSRIKVRQEREAAEARRRSREVERNKTTPESDDDDVIIEKVVVSPPKKQLAPIFGKKKLKRIPLDPERAAARKAFLLSTAPETLRLQVSMRNPDSNRSVYVDYSKLTHIKQKDNLDPFWNLCDPNLKLVKEEAVVNDYTFEGFHLGLSKSSISEIKRQKKFEDLARGKFSRQ